MDIFEAIAGRRSIRRYKEAPVPDADIKKIIDAGRLAPSANNVQPWNAAGTVTTTKSANERKVGHGIPSIYLGSKATMPYAGCPALTV